MLCGKSVLFIKQNELVNSKVFVIQLNEISLLMANQMQVEIKNSKLYSFKFQEGIRRLLLLCVYVVLVAALRVRRR